MVTSGGCVRLCERDLFGRKQDRLKQKRREKANCCNENEMKLKIKKKSEAKFRQLVVTSNENHKINILDKIVKIINKIQTSSNSKFY